MVFLLKFLILSKISCKIEKNNNKKKKKISILSFKSFRISQI